MDYIQALASFFNAPLFAIFILGLFWKRMTGTAGWTGLISASPRRSWSTSWSAPTSSNVSSQAGSFLGASAAFFAGAVGVGLCGVTQFTTSKSDEELAGLVWALETTEEPRRGGALVDARWYPSSPSSHGRASFSLFVVVFYIMWW